MDPGYSLGVSHLSLTKREILEALQRGKAIVTTPIGAQGLDGIGNSPVVVRETPSDLASACVRLLASREARLTQEHRAHSAARLLPTWEHAAKALADCWTSLTNTAASGGGEYRETPRSSE